MMWRYIWKHLQLIKNGHCLAVCCLNIYVTITTRGHKAWEGCPTPGLVFPRIVAHLSVNFARVGVARSCSFMAQGSHKVFLSKLTISLSFPKVKIAKIVNEMVLVLF